MSKIGEILSGWGNKTLDQFGLLDKETQELGEKRLLVCMNCTVRTDFRCDSNKQGEVQEDFSFHGEQRKKGEIYNGCGCNLQAKSLSPNSQCPLGYWEGINK